MRGADFWRSFPLGCRLFVMSPSARRGLAGIVPASQKCCIPCWHAGKTAHLPRLVVAVFVSGPSAYPYGHSLCRAVSPALASPLRPPSIDTEFGPLLHLRKKVVIRHVLERRHGLVVQRLRALRVLYGAAHDTRTGACCTHAHVRQGRRWPLAHAYSGSASTPFWPFRRSRLLPRR